jgi:Cu/Ag efflux protein CusF
MRPFLIALALAGVLALLVIAPSVALAQSQPVVHEKETVVKATIEAIDRDTRMITLKDKDGKSVEVLAGPEVRRFAELKIGDVVTFHTTESVVYRIRKPGEASQPSGKDAPVVVRSAGAKPGATKTTQETKIVTLKEVDPKTQGVTIQTEDGRTMSFKVEDKNILKGLAPGDKVVISYTTAVAISVE